MGVTSNDVQLAVKRLRENPADEKALRVVLNFVEEIKQDYFRPGEYYQVHLEKRGPVIKELAAFLGPCSPGCPSRGCPGVLQFKDGTEACPFPDYGPLIRRALPDPTFVAIHKIEELLRSGKKSAKVELVDGRWVSISIKKSKD